MTLQEEEDSDAEKAAKKSDKEIGPNHKSVLRFWQPTSVMQDSSDEKENEDKKSRDPYLIFDALCTFHVERERERDRECS